MKCIDYDKLCEKIQQPDYTLYSAGDRGAWLGECLDKADVFEAITREQYHDMTERFFDEFVDNGADEETVAKCMFIGLAFGKLELMLFGENEDGDTCD